MELICKDLVFHFNKKHLEDSTIPMWVIKTAGKTYYVNHVTSQVPWSTKETPDNTHTKGSIKLKKVKLTIDDNNDALIEAASNEDFLKNYEKKIHARIIISVYLQEIKKFLIERKCKVGEFKTIYGECSSEFLVVDIYDQADFLMLQLSGYDKCWRVLSENEEYYIIYDNRT